MSQRKNSAFRQKVFLLVPSFRADCKTRLPGSGAAAGPLLAEHCGAVWQTAIYHKHAWQRIPAYRVFSRLSACRCPS